MKPCLWQTKWKEQNKLYVQDLHHWQGIYQMTGRKQADCLHRLSLRRRCADTYFFAFVCVSFSTSTIFLQEINMVEGEKHL